MLSFFIKKITLFIFIQVCGLCPAGWGFTSTGCEFCPDSDQIDPVRLLVLVSALAIFCSIWYMISWRPMILTEDSGFTSTDLNKALRETKQQLAIAKKKMTAFIRAERLYAIIKKWITWLLGEEAAQKIRSFTTEHVSQYLKLYVSFLQVVSSFLTFPVVWPSLFQKTLELIKGTLFLDILQLPKLSCLWVGINFQQRLMTYTLGPLVVAVLFLVPVCFAWVAGYGKKKSHSWVAVLDSAWKNIMFWIFLVYPIVSLTTLQAFDCQPEGLERLAADYSQPCPEDSQMLRVWSSVFILIYPVGIPLFCMLAMLRMGVHLVAQDKYDFNVLSAMVAKYSQLTTSIESRRIATMFRIGGAMKEELDEEIEEACAEMLDTNGNLDIESLKDIRIKNVEPNLIVNLLNHHSQQGETYISFQKFRYNVKIEKEIRSVYNSFFDDDGEFKRLPSKEVDLMGVESQSIRNFFQMYDKNNDNKISLNEFRVMALNILETTSLFTGVEGDRLTKEQAVALLMFDWKSAVNQSGDDDELGFGDSQQEEDQVGGNQDEESSGNQDQNNVKDGNNDTVPVMDEKEGEAKNDIDDDDEGGDGDSMSKGSETEDKSVKMKREKLLREACNKCKHKVSAEIRRLAQSLVDDKVISVPDMLWPSSSIIDLSASCDVGTATRDDSKEQESKNLEDFVIHPDLADDYLQKTGMSKFINFIASGSFDTQISWSTVNKRKELERKAIRRVGFVFSAYKSNLWYWEMIEMLRK
jgi:Ca2+-binding EF-hand superfamily protein